MGRRHFLVLLLACYGTFPMIDTARAAHPEPIAVNAPVATFSYQSAFEGYRPFADETIKPWRESNDLARRLGGWSAFAGGKTPDAGAPESRSDEKSSAVAPAKPEPQGTHSGHGRR